MRPGPTKLGPTRLMLLAMASVTFACSSPSEPADPGAAGTTEPAPSASAPKEDIGQVLASVGDVEIGAEEFQAAAQRKAPANGESLSAAEKREILDELITEKLLYQEARKKGIDRDPKVQKVMINTLLRQDVYANVRNSDFSQEELEAYFEAHRDEFVVPEKVQVKRIFVRAGDRRSDGEAQRIAEDLRSQVAQNPDRFRELATEHSEDPYRRRGGDLGFVSKEGKPGVPPEVIEAAFGLEVGQVSDVFEAGDGYNVVYVANKRERVERTFEQMKGSVLRKVKNERYKELYDAYVQDVGGAYPVKVDEQALATVEVEAARRLTLGGARRAAHDDADEE